ncbi:MAG: SAM-dependent methyltransferase [Clostridia bacterium]|nr:SAM-dependent methyltransferase [Clostridia bacterium]
MNIESVLTPRLRAIADSVPTGATLADVGTDHGYVPIYLCQKNVIEKALAMDVKEGPLSRAQNNIERFGMKEKVETRLSDGLCALQQGEVDTAVIAGMGGLLIAQILEEAPFYLKTYILQPMTATAELRAYLEEKGYRISYEVLAKEDEKIYTIIRAERGEMKIEKPVYYHVGKRLLEQRDPLAPLLIGQLLTKYQQTLCGLDKAEKENVSEKKQQISDLIKELLTLKEVCSTW